MRVYGYPSGLLVGRLKSLRKATKNVATKSPLRLRSTYERRSGQALRRLKLGGVDPAEAIGDNGAMKRENADKNEPLRYVAFLRGINVSGKKLIKMQDLKRMFEGMGFANVKTYIQSGNVIFESLEKDTAALRKMIEAGLKRELRYELVVLLRTVGELEEMVKRNPFKKIKDADVGMYVTFMAEECKTKPKLPLFSKKQDVKVLEITGRDAFCLALPTGDGHYGFPNAFIEKEFKLAATTRNWTTVTALCLLVIQ